MKFAAVIVGLIGLVGLGICGNSDRIIECADYHIPAEVVSIDGRDITLETDGDLWIYRESLFEKYEIGDEVTLIMDDMGTLDICDDEILDIY